MRLLLKDFHIENWLKKMEILMVASLVQHGSIALLEMGQDQRFRSQWDTQGNYI